MATSKPLDPSSLPVGPFSRDLIDAKSDDGEKSGGNLGDLLDQVSKGSVANLFHTKRSQIGWTLLKCWSGNDQHVVAWGLAP